MADRSRTLLCPCGTSFVPLVGKGSMQLLCLGCVRAHNAGMAAAAPSWIARPGTPKLLRSESGPVCGEAGGVAPVPLRRVR